MRFFITGLPRSRTKWFADYFNNLTGVLCWHEAMNGCHSDRDFFRKMTSYPVRHIGNSDSGLMFSRFQQQFPNAPTVIIERDIDDVEYSLKRFLGPQLAGEPSIRPTLERQKEKLEAVKGLRVPYEQINDRLQEIHEYLVSNPFDEGYAQDWIETNRQVKELVVDVESYKFWGAA